MTIGTEPPTTYERLVAAAAELTTELGWAQVTMGKVAGRVAVSRQTVYNEFGSKQQLAEAMVLGELGKFLEQVNVAFDAHPDDLMAAIEGAARGVLELARTNKLLLAVVETSHGAETELLPLLTSQSQTLIETAKSVIDERIEAYELPLDEAHLEAAVDTIVRVVLSHVIRPSGTPQQTAADIAWIAGRVLRPTP